MSASSLTIPVIVTEGHAYLLLNTSISPLLLRFPSPSFRLKSTLDKEFRKKSQTELNILFLEETCRAIFQTFLQGDTTIYTCLIYPERDLKPISFTTKYSTELITDSIIKSSTIVDAETEALDIIKGFGASFVSNEAKETLLAKALTILHHQFVKGPSKV